MMGVQEIMQGLQLYITVSTVLDCRVRESSWGVLRLDLSIDTRKRRSPFQAVGRRHAIKGRHGRVDHGLFHFTHQTPCLPMTRMSPEITIWYFPCLNNWRKPEPWQSRCFLFFLLHYVKLDAVETGKKNVSPIFCLFLINLPWKGLT